MKPDFTVMPYWAAYIVKKPPWNGRNSCKAKMYRWNELSQLSTYSCSTIEREILMMLVSTPSPGLC